MVKEMTETNLRSAYAGESQAHMRYLIYSERAEKNKFPNVARLFQATSFAEKVHAGNHYRIIKSKGEAVTFSGAIFGTTNTSEDLQAGIDGETFEVNEMYPAYIAVANLQGENAAAKSFEWALAAEKTHLVLYEKAKKSVDQGKDASFGPINVCSVCGYTLEGEAPNKCPICNSPKEKFKSF
ncbi:MAG: rubrerythrin family protein [Candidatus Freyarchaeota archaeon]|nr:rubrerythrin family protein [Candidatus Jordarchaeia archaeon]